MFLDWKRFQYCFCFDDSCDVAVANPIKSRKIARKTVRIINIGIGFALSINIIAMALAILGYLNPIEGALIHNIGSVVVIVFSSSLINYKTFAKSKKTGLSKNLNKTKLKKYKAYSMK